MNFRPGYFEIESENKCVISNIIKVAHLVEFISNPKISKQEKVNAIKNARDNGEITTDEAIDLAVEYC